MYSCLVEELHEELQTRGAGFTSSSRLFDQIEGGVDTEGSEHPSQGQTSPSWIVGRQAEVCCQIRQDVNRGEDHIEERKGKNTFYSENELQMLSLLHFTN